MATIQIKNVPEETHATLVRRAKASHQSLQEFLLQRLNTEARRLTWPEVVDRTPLEPGEGITLEQATAAVREDRDRR